MLSGEDYVPVIGFSYFWAITSLLESLESIPPTPPNEVQASNRENGCAAALIALTAFLFESATGRAQYIKNITPAVSPLKYIRNYHPDPSVYDDIEEIFVVRDIIAHNHIWDARIGHNASGDLQLLSATLRAGYGDAKYNRVVDRSTRMTRRLGLNAFPTRIWYNDSVIVLRKGIDFLLQLEADDRRIFALTNQPIKYKGQVQMFVQLVRSLQLVPSTP